MHTAILRQLNNAFSSLQAPITVFDRKGQLLIGTIRGVVSAPIHLSGGESMVVKGQLFYKTDLMGGLILMTKHTPYAMDVLLLASALIKSIGAQEFRFDKLSLTKLLTDDMSLPEIDAVFKEHGILPDGMRRVLVFSMQNQAQLPAHDELKTLFPADAVEYFVPISEHLAAIIIPPTFPESDEDIEQLALALMETAESENSIRMNVGIGNWVKDMRHIRTSFLEAKEALHLGTAFRTDQSVHLYRRCLLERIIKEFPRDKAQDYIDELFNHKTARLFTDEMLTTITTLLENDMNIANTAAKLFLHRNTLLYRINKVYQETGLDLRKLRDAMIFKLLYDLKRQYRDN